MKAALLGTIVLSLALLGCNSASDELNPSNNQNVLGLVVRVESSQSAGLILLKDGRAISPQSGFNPDYITTGNKFLLSFNPISSSGKILNVEVTHFASANDAVFTPPATTMDTSLLKNVLAGSHPCTFTSAVVDYSNAADTMKVVKEFNIVVNGNTFTSNAPYEPVPGGAGIFYFNGNEPDNLHFDNYAELPNMPGIPPGYLLSGQYFHAVFDEYVIIWEYTNTSYSGFLIER